jgi:hypothetical protein
LYKYIRMIAFAALTIITPAIQGATVTFGDTEIFPLINYTEAGFTFQVLSGGFWGITEPGNPEEALSSGTVDANPLGATLEIFRNGGGFFSFFQFDFRNRIGTTPDTINIFGEVNSATIYSILNFGGSSTTTFQTQLTGFGDVDRIRIEIASIGDTDLLMDNFELTNLSDVPEPASGALAGLVLVGGCILRSRASRR